MLDFHRIFGLKTVVFRHSSMYGSRQFATYDQGWVGWFVQKAIEKKNEYKKQRDGIVEKKGAEEAHKKKLENDYDVKDKKLKALMEKNKQLGKINEQIDYKGLISK